ncbi:MAG: carbohydrate binding domain-containing protein [Clostridia bacterium]|nr:carbohydrate binding domain-containing protein [Clostridia bacterium]
MQTKLRKALAVLATLTMLCTLLPLGAMSVAAADVDLLVNGDFETGNGNGWTLESGTSVSSSDKHDGSYAIQTTNTSTKYQLMMRQTIEVAANTDYVFTFWYKYVGSNSGPSFYAIVKDGNESVNLNDANSRISPSNGNWTQVSHTVNSGDYTSLTLVFQNRTAGDGGTYYFDDITFVGPEPVASEEPENPVPEVKDNLVENGNFETGDFTGWEKHQSTSVSADAAYTGYYGAKLSGNGGWGGMLNQSVPVVAGGSYKVAMWVKTVSNGANIQLKDGDANGAKLGSEWFTGTEWTYKTWTVSPTTNTLFINFCGGGNGVAETVYVDDITVTKAPLIDNGDFETGDKTGWSCNSGTATIVTDAYSGNYALQISNPAQWGEAAVRTIGVKPNTQYEVAFKAKRVSGTGAFNLIVCSPVSPWTKFTKISGQNWMAANDATDANGWASYSCVYNSDEFTQMLLKFTSEVASAGSIILDDITVTELKEPSFDGYLYNGDFETGKTNPWTTYQGTDAAEDAACSGDYGLCLQGNGGWGGMAYQDIATVPGENYYFYGYFKANAAGVNIQILDQATSTKLASTWFNKTSWSVVKLKFVAKGTTTRINFCGGGTGTAEKVYADDMFIVAVTPQGSSFDGYIYNGDFEAGTTVNWSTHQQTILSTKAAYEGAAGVIMKGTGGWGGTLNQSFNVDMGNTYKLSFRYKPISNGLNVQILDADDSSKLASDYLSTANGTDWMLYEKTFSVGYTTKVTLNFCGGGTGSTEEMYVDNVSIVNLGGEENVRNLLTHNGGVSVRDLADDNRGLAFRFHLDADGVQVAKRNQYVLGTGSLDLYKNRQQTATLLRAGAVVTNNATIGEDYDALTLDNVNGTSVVDVNARYLIDLEDDSMGYAVRIISIPDHATATEIYARPYYVYDVDGEEVVVYGALSHDSYDGVAGEHKTVSVLSVGNEDSDALDILPSLFESADYDSVVIGNLYNDAAPDFGADYTYERYQYGEWTATDANAADVLAEGWDCVVIRSADGTLVTDLQTFISAVDAATDAPLYWDNDQNMTQVSLTGVEEIIPTATALANIRGTGVTENDFIDDYTTALAWFGVLTDETLDQADYYPAQVADDYYDVARSVAHAMYNPYAVADLSEVVLLAGSDFQPSGGNVEAGRQTVRNILGAMADAGYGLFDGFMSGGDYSTGTSHDETTAGLAGLDAEISRVVYNNKFYSQGNHDPATTVGMTPHGAHDPFGAPYGLYVINEDNYSDLGDGGENVAKELESYFDEKLNNGWGNKPIFVLCHVPLNFSMRSVTGQNARTAMPIVETLNEAGEAGLNIIFLYGHNHSGGYDNYIGGGSVYLKKGDTMLVPNYVDCTVPAEVTLNFTYTTAGYIGYYGTTVNGADGALTMTVFRIQEDGSVIIGRYDENGIHNLKSAGAKNTDRSDIMEPDLTVYESYRVVTATSDEEYIG